MLLRGNHVNATGFTTDVFGVIFLLLLLLLEEIFVARGEQVIVRRRSLGLRSCSSHQRTAAEVEVDLRLARGDLGDSDSLRQLTLRGVGGPPGAAVTGALQSDNQETEEEQYDCGRHEDEDDAEEVERRA